MEENMGLEMGVEAEGVANLEPEVVTEPETTEEVVAETVEATEAELQKKIQDEMGIDAAGNPVAPQPQMPSIEEQMVQEISQPPEGQRTRLQEEYGSEEQ